MPKNCSKDVSRVVDYVDRVASSGTKEQQQKLKELFGLGDLEHFDDFAAYVYPQSQHGSLLTILKQCP